MGDTEVDLAVLIRPAKEADARFQVDQRQLKIIIKAAKQATVDNRHRDKVYHFDKIYDGKLCGGKRLYHENIGPLVLKCIRGGNATVVSYGETKTGKTYSLFHPEVTIGADCSGDEGLVLLSLRELDAWTRKQKSLSSKVWLEVTCCEVIGGRVFDMLSTTSKVKQEQLHSPPSSPVNRDAKKYVVVDSRSLKKTEIKNLRSHKVQDVGKTISLLNRVMKQRLEDAHVVISILLRTDSNRLTGKLQFIDLASRSRVFSSELSSQMRQQKLQQNKSLAFFQQLFACLLEAEKTAVPQLHAPVSSHVPYRQTIITNLFRDLFNKTGSEAQKGGLFLLCCIRADSDHLAGTVATLRLAKLVQRLKREKHGSVANSVSPELRGSPSCSLPPEIGTLIQEYFAAETPRSASHHLASIREKQKEGTSDDVADKRLTEMLEKIRQCLRQRNDVVSEGNAVTYVDEEKYVERIRHFKKTMEETTAGVKTVSTNVMSIGIAPENFLDGSDMLTKQYAFPASEASLMSADEHLGKDFKAVVDEQDGTKMQPEKEVESDPRVAQDKEGLVNGEVLSVHRSLDDCMQQLEKIKQAKAELKTNLRRLKAIIDDLKVQLGMGTSSRNDGGELKQPVETNVLGEDQLSIRKCLSRHKKQFRESHLQLETLNQELSVLKGEKNDLKKQLSL